MIRPLVAFAGLALCVMSLPGPVRAAGDPLGAAIAAMPADIEDVRLVGKWARDGKSGLYRVTVARRGGGESFAARVFVQWLAYSDTDVGTIEATTEIAEIPAMKANVVDLAVDDEDGRLTLVLQLSGPGIDEAKSYEAVIKGPGEYVFQDAGN